MCTDANPSVVRGLDSDELEQLGTTAYLTGRVDDAMAALQRLQQLHARQGDRRPPDVQPGRHGAVGVAFASRRGRNAADDEIVTMVAGDPDPAGGRVVTSDRRLAERVRDLGAGVEPSSRFRRRVDRVLTTDPYR